MSGDLGWVSKNKPSRPYPRLLDVKTLGWSRVPDDCDDRVHDVELFVNEIQSSPSDAFQT